MLRVWVLSLLPFLLTVALLVAAVAIGPLIEGTVR